MDDFTYARILFGQGKIDVACLWEPDVTLALASRPGAHRLFSTADATELVADTLVAKQEFLDLYPDLAVKLARVWFAGVKKAEADRPAAARLISTVCSRFRDELGYEATLKALRAGSSGPTSPTTSACSASTASRPPSTASTTRRRASGSSTRRPRSRSASRPATVRDDRVVRRIWEAEGKNVARAKEKFRARRRGHGQAAVHQAAVGHLPQRQERADAHRASRPLDEMVVPQMQMAAGMYIRVEGNTDSLGDEDWNRGLSERRAEAIVEYLVSRGIERSRIVARGNGSAKAVASNKTARGSRPQPAHRHPVHPFEADRRDA